MLTITNHDNVNIVLVNVVNRPRIVFVAWINNNEQWSLGDVNDRSVGHLFKHIFFKQINCKQTQRERDRQTKKKVKRTRFKY